MTVCPTCGTVFESIRTGHGWKKYCSNKCLGIANGNRLRNKPRPIEHIRKLRETVRSRYQPHFDLTPEQLGYVAGLLDAEGNIYHYARGVRNLFTTRIAIFNTNKIMLEKVCSWLGFGTVGTRHFSKSDKHFGAKQVHFWVNSISEFSWALLSLLLPYLRVKYDKASKILNVIRKKTPMSWPYVAAFFDGEGSASFYEKEGLWAISFSNSDFAVLKEIQEFMGFGQIYPLAGTKKPMWNLRLARHDAQVKFGEAVLSFLMIKKEKIRAMVDFIKGKEWDMDHWGGHKLAHVSDEDLRHKYLEEKKSIQQLATEYNVKYNPMREHLLKHDIPLRSTQEGTRLRHAAIYNFPKETVLSRYNDGESARRLAKELGIGHHALCKWLRDNGVKVRPKLWKLHDVSSEELLLRYHDGWSVRQLAEQYKVSSQAMYQYLRKLGVAFSPEQRPTEDLVQTIAP